DRSALAGRSAPSRELPLLLAFRGCPRDVERESFHSRAYFWRASASSSATLAAPLALVTALFATPFTIAHVFLGVHHSCNFLPLHVMTHGFSFEKYSKALSLVMAFRTISIKAIAAATSAAVPKCPLNTSAGILSKENPCPILPAVFKRCSIMSFIVCCLLNGTGGSGARKLTTLRACGVEFGVGGSGARKLATFGAAGMDFGVGGSGAR